MPCTSNIRNAVSSCRRLVQLFIVFLSSLEDRTTRKECTLLIQDKDAKTAFYLSMTLGLLGIFPPALVKYNNLGVQCLFL